MRNPSLWWTDRKHDGPHKIALIVLLSLLRYNINRITHCNPLTLSITLSHTHTHTRARSLRLALYSRLLTSLTASALDKINSRRACAVSTNHTAVDMRTTGGSAASSKRGQTTARWAFPQQWRFWETPTWNNVCIKAATPLLLRSFPATTDYWFMTIGRVAVAQYLGDDLHWLTAGNGYTRYVYICIILCQYVNIVSVPL